MKAELAKAKALDVYQMLIDQGFDCLKFPGGTSRNGNFFEGGIIYRFNEQGKIQFLLVPYNSHFFEHESVSAKPEKETENALLQREIFEETGLKIKDSALNATDNTVFEKSVPDKRPTHVGQFHKKRFRRFPLESCEGEVASYTGKNPIEPETGSPLWLELDVLAVVFSFDGKDDCQLIHSSHLHLVSANRIKDSLLLLGVEFFYGL